MAAKPRVRNAAASVIGLRFAAASRRRRNAEPGTISKTSFVTKASALVRRYVADRGWHLILLYQHPQTDSRKLSRVALPTDPWHAIIADQPSALAAETAYHGHGATADAAVLAAIPHDLLESLRRCETAVDNLHDCLQKLLREEN